MTDPKLLAAQIAANAKPETKETAMAFLKMALGDLASPKAVRKIEMTKIPSDIHEISADWFAEERDRSLSAGNTTPAFQIPQTAEAEVADDNDFMYNNRNTERNLIKDWYDGDVPANILKIIDSPEKNTDIQSIANKKDPELVAYSGTPVITGPYTSILGAAKAGAAIGTDMAVFDYNFITAGGAYALQMKVDNEGIYHADFDCWQAAFGYNNFYDSVFGAVTSMDKENFKFTSGGKDYVLWAWKGDYWNLGAGAELGIYKDVYGSEGHYAVDKSLAMQMSMTLQYTDPETGKFSTIITYDPSDPQWWITSFDPKYMGVKASDLTAYFTVKFKNKEMYDDFYKAYGQNSMWTFQAPNGYTVNDYMATLKF